MRIILLAIFLVYLGITLFGYFYAEKMIFYPHAVAYRIPVPIIKLKTSDGAEVAAVYLPNPDAKYTLLYSHGNAEDLNAVFPVLERLQRTGVSVLAYDYHGYGESTGHPSEANAYADINAAYDYLTQKLHILPGHIIVHGRSLGGGVAADLASRYRLGGLILESTFLSTYRVVIPYPIFLFDKFKTYAKLKQITCPILVIHGTQDEVIPFEHGKTLYEKADQPKRAFWVEGAHHNDLVYMAGHRYDQAIQAFRESL